MLSHEVAPGVRCLTLAAWTLWCLGYPAQALQRSQEAQALAQALAHPQSLVAGTCRLRWPEDGQSATVVVLPVANPLAST